MTKYNYNSKDRQIDPETDVIPQMYCGTLKTYDWSVETPTWAQAQDLKDFVGKQIERWKRTRKVEKPKEAWKGYFLTVNPPPEFTQTVIEKPDLLKKAIKVLMKKQSWMKDITLVVEQRSENVIEKSDVQGIHFHIKITQLKPYRPSYLQRDWKRFIKQKSHQILMFKSLMWGTNIRADAIKTADDIQRIDDYISGVKADESKTKKCLADKTMRNLFDLMKFYEN